MRALFLTAAILMAATPAMSEQETLVRRPDATYVTVRTDESGTTVNEEKQGKAGEPISPGDEAHWGKVFELTKAGAQVISHKSVAAP